MSIKSVALLVLVLILLPIQALTQDTASETASESPAVTHQITTDSNQTESKSYMFGSSYSFRDSLDKFWVHFTPAVYKTGWLGPSMSISSLMVLVMTGPDGVKPYDSHGYRTKDSTTGGIGFYGNCGIKLNQAALITSFGLELTITEEQRRDRFGDEWNEVSKVIGKPVAQIGFRSPFVGESKLELGYKTSGTTFITLLIPLKD